MERFRKLGKCISAHQHGVWSVSGLDASIHGNRQDFITGGADGQIRTWRLLEGGPNDNEINKNHPDHVNGKDFEDIKKANEQDIALGSDSPCVPVHTLSGHALAVVNVAVAKEGTIAASTSLDGTLKIWDLARPIQEPRSISLEVTECWGVALSTTGEAMVSCGAGGSVQVFDTKMGLSEQSMSIERKKKEGDHFRVEKPMAMCVALSPDDRHVAVGASDGNITIFDVHTGKVVCNSFPPHAASIRSLMYIPSERGKLVTASDDQLVNFYDVDAAQITGTCRGHAGHVLCVTASPDGQHITSGGTDNTVRVWDRMSKQCLFKSMEHKESVWGVAYCSQGKLILSVSDDASIGVIDSTHAKSVL